MGTIGKCKMCGQKASLVNAHIIPNSFYMPMLRESNYAHIIPNTPSQYPRRLTTGIYDPALVCIDCEASFSPFDDYGKAFLLDTDWASTDVFPKESPLLHIIANYDHHKLKLFIMSVLWRMAATSRFEFHHVHIGPHLKCLQSALQGHTCGSVDDWSVLFGRFNQPHPKRLQVDPRHSWLDPHHTRLAGRNFVKMYMADFIIHVKVDSLPLQGHIRQFSMRPDGPLYGFMRNFETSRELALMAKMSRSHSSR